MTAAELAAARLAARTVDEILTAEIRIAWAKAHDGADCPPEHTVNPAAALGAWVVPIDVVRAAVAAASDAVGLDAPPWPVVSPTDAAIPFGFALYSLFLAIRSERPDLLPSPDPSRHPVEDQHAAWRALPEPRPPFWLAHLVAAWQAAQPIERDRRPRGILPDSWRRARYHDHLPLLQRPYPEAPGKMAGDQHLLPLAELETPSVVVPALPLALYDSGAGPLASRGRGAPYAQRLFVEVLLDVGRLDRVPGQTARVEVPLRDLVTWLWPKRWQRTRSGDRPGDLEQLQRALLELDGTRVLWDRMLWRLVGVQALPTTTTRLDDVIVFRVEHLPGSEHGPLIDRDSVRRWGAVSAPNARHTPKRTSRARRAQHLTRRVQHAPLGCSHRINYGSTAAVGSASKRRPALKTSGAVVLPFQFSGRQ